MLSTGEPFEIVTPSSYLAQLGGEYVLADVEVRRQKIRKALDKVRAQIADARWREDHALVDAVTHLTEWPDVLLGNFEPAYLELPEEVLVTVMRDHQKYFAVEDASGKLAPHFLTVTNIALDQVNARIIKQGNERVLRARFNDARFFWEFDQRTPLAERVKLLENVTFQKDLGSYAAKSERVAAIAQHLATLAIARGCGLDERAIAEAALPRQDRPHDRTRKGVHRAAGPYRRPLCRSQGLTSTVAHAIYDQYLPASAKDAIPRSPEGAILGIADRIDTIAEHVRPRHGAHGIQRPLRPSPRGQRHRPHPGRVVPAPLLGDVINGRRAGAKDTETRLLAFFAERIDFYLQEARGQAYDVVKAAMAAGTDDLRDLVARAEAVTAVRGSEDFLAVSAAFKRMKNILTQAHAKGDVPPSIVDHDLLLDPAEKLLAVTASAAASALQELQRERNYGEAMRVIAALRPSIDDFFDKVMVMSPEADIRAQPARATQPHARGPLPHRRLLGDRHRRLSPTSPNSVAAALQPASPPAARRSRSTAIGWRSRSASPRLG